MWFIACQSWLLADLGFGSVRIVYCVLCLVCKAIRPRKINVLILVLARGRFASNPRKTKKKKQNIDSMRTFAFFGCFAFFRMCASDFGLKTDNLFYEALVYTQTIADWSSVEPCVPTGLWQTGRLQVCSIVFWIQVSKFLFCPNCACGFRHSFKKVISYIEWAVNDNVRLIDLASKLPSSQ